MSGPTSTALQVGLIPDFWGGLGFTVAPARPQIGHLSETTAAARKNTREKISHISYDKKNQASKPSQQAPDLPPEPGAHGAFACKHEYKHHGTVSLFAGIDLVTGPVPPPNASLFTVLQRRAISLQSNRPAKWRERRRDDHQAAGGEQPRMPKDFRRASS
jgi:hypothetical protein